MGTAGNHGQYGGGGRRSQDPFRHPFTMQGFHVGVQADLDAEADSQQNHIDPVLGKLLSGKGPVRDQADYSQVESK